MTARRSVRRGSSGGVRRAVAVVTLLVIGAVAAHADIESVHQRWQELQAQEAAFLAPRRHKEADTAMRALDAPGQTGGAAAALAEAEKRLQVLDEALRRAQSLWADMLRVRAEAREAGAPTVDPRGWKTAENVLFAAAQKLETDRIDAAKKQAQEARPLYDAARTTALRATMLQGADSILARLEEQKARVYVPRSYVRALDARTAANKLFAERGKLDPEVRAAGDRAASEARHARFLFERIHGACEQRAPDRLESSILDWEESTQRTLQAMGLTGSSETGLSPPLESIEKEAARLRSERDRLRVDTSRRAGAADSLGSAVGDLRDQVRDRDLQIAELQRVVAEQDVVTHIQESFRRDEGRVLIDGRDLILRLHGLQFPSGKAEIPAPGAALLDKVVQVVKKVPGARLVVEGHTDAQGKPETNQLLSQQRADAVRDYLVSHAGLDAGRVTTIGYGANRPVASNDTEDGRALNRRIEIIVARPE